MNPTHIYDLQAQRIDGSNLSMADLRGKVLLNNKGRTTDANAANTTTHSKGNTGKL